MPYLDSINETIYYKIQEEIHNQMDSYWSQNQQSQFLIILYWGTISASFHCIGFCSVWLRQGMKVSCDKSYLLQSSMHRESLTASRPALCPCLASSWWPHTPCPWHLCRLALCLTPDGAGHLDRRRRTRHPPRDESNQRTTLVVGNTDSQTSDCPWTRSRARRRCPASSGVPSAYSNLEINDHYYQ